MRKLTLLFVILFISVAYAEVEFAASVDRNVVSEGEMIRITFTLNQQNAGNFRAPDFRGFSVVSGPSTQKGTRIVNGDVTVSFSIQYILKAESAGTYTIGGASVEHEGRLYTSKPINITVTKSGSANQGQQDKSLDAQAQEILSRNIFLRTYVSQNNVYRGESFLVTYKLYINPNLSVRNTSIKRNPSLPGFWVEDLTVESKNREYEVLNGVRYQTYTLKQSLLTPQQFGKLEIDPLEYDFVVRLRVNDGSRRRDSFFDDFFSSGSYQDFKYTTSSGTKLINVKPLPEGSPASFDGAVGDMEFEAWLEGEQVNQNEPVSYKIKISGKGNLRLLDAPTLDLPPDIEIYEPKVSDNITVNARGMSGSIIYEYLLIPKNPGKYKLNELAFSYFNPIESRYYEEKQGPFKLDVEKGSGDVTFVSGSRKEDVQFLGKDIRYIKNTPGRFYKEQTSFFGSFAFWSLYIVPLLITILALLLYNKKREVESNAALVKNKKANKIARKRLSAAKSIMEKNSGSGEFYDEINKGIWGYLSDKLSIPVSKLSRANANESLRKYNVDEETINEFIGLIEECEYARYAPFDDVASQSEVYKRAIDVIGKMEKMLR